MQEQKASVFSNGLIWFGAAISIAEIITGTFIASLGFKQGMLAILTGHLIGGVLIYLVGLIGARTGKSSMDTVKESFGEKGAGFFSSLNVLQLVGWTAIMIISGAAAANSIIAVGSWLWSCVIGLLICIWIIIGIKNLGKVNIFAMSGLFILTIILSTVIFRGNGQTIISGDMSFGAAVELSVAMPLSWLPLVSDYTRRAKRKMASSAVSAITYTLVSSWMYMIGLGAAIFTGESDIAAIMMSAGLGIAGLLIIILSTVTTTFLDVFSAGMSAESISRKFDSKTIAFIVTVLGTVLAVFTPITGMEPFLYLIGSVFAPMIAIQLANFYFVKRDFSNQNISVLNFFIWIVGFTLYRIFLHVDTPLGSTVPVMLFIMIIYVLIYKFKGGKQYAEENA